MSPDSPPRCFSSPFFALGFFSSPKFKEKITHTHIHSWSTHRYMQWLVQINLQTCTLRVWIWLSTLTDLFQQHFKIWVKHSKIRVKHSWNYCLEQINLLRTLPRLFRVSVPIIVLISGLSQTFLRALFSCLLPSITPYSIIFSSFPPTLNLSGIRVFSSESVLCIRWPKYWVSASSSVPPMNIQDRFPLGWTGWISLQSKGL